MSGMALIPTEQVWNWTVLERSPARVTLEGQYIPKGSQRRAANLSSISWGAQSTRYVLK